MSEEWSCDEEGYINLHEDIATAVREYFYDIDPEWMAETVTVHRYERVNPTARDCGSPLEYVLENLDDEYLADECQPDNPTQAMLEAEKAFINAVLAEYKMSSLRAVESVTVNVSDYLER
jgi:hypothetical protein